MKTIINLTQHAATPEQVAAGVVDLTGLHLDRLKYLLTFDWLPNADEISWRAKEIAALAAAHPTASRAMIGGAGYLISSVEDALESRGLIPVHSFSPRVSEEQVQPDGSVRKVNVFRHQGWVGDIWDDVDPPLEQAEQQSHVLE